MHDEVFSTYAARKASLVASLKAPHNADAAPLGLSKRTSTLFRARDEGTKRRLDLSDLNHVIEVDTPHSWVDVEGMTCYEESGRRDSDTRRDAGGVAAAETHHGRRRRGSASDGIKSLYSDCFFSCEEFAAACGMSAYSAMKAKYDAHGRMMDLHEKCVLPG